MNKITINENQRGLLFRNGCYKKLLTPGRYRLMHGSVIEIAELTQPLTSLSADDATLLADPVIARQTVTADVPDRQLWLHYVNDRFTEVLSKGRHIFWNIHDAHTFTPVDVSTPEIAPDFPTDLFAEMPPHLYQRIEVEPFTRALLFFDRRFIRLLEPGVYRFWNMGVKVNAQPVDTRLIQQVVPGQELLTRDKVTLRVTLTVTYRVTDPVKVFTEVDDYQNHLYTAAQLALRDFVGQYALDELLESKERMSAFVLEQLRGRQKELFIEIREAGVRDVILPGEIRDIMNAVLTAEKKAQANVITRREEVASTRSLLNTAKLMEENPTLCKLKELEYVERICQNVGSINLTGSGDLLGQLAAVLKGA